MPPLPVTIDQAGAVVAPPAPVTEDSPPYLRIAADLRAAIKCGALQPGDRLPTIADLAVRYDVSTGTAYRSIAELAKAGQVRVSPGKRASVTSVTSNVPV
jgi:DNA-binding GntR family transcriptional regulator